MNWVTKPVGTSIFFLLEYWETCAKTTLLAEANSTMLSFSFFLSVHFASCSSLQGKSQVTPNTPSNGLRGCRQWNQSQLPLCGFTRGWCWAEAPRGGQDWVCLSQHTLVTGSLCPAPHLLSPLKSDYWCRPALSSAKQLLCFSCAGAWCVLQLRFTEKWNFKTKRVVDDIVVLQRWLMVLDVLLCIG